MLHAHLILSRPNPLPWRIHHFSKEPLFLLLENGIRSQHLGTGSQRFLDTRVWHYLISILSAFHWVLWRRPLGGGQRRTVTPVKRTSQSSGWEVWRPPGASELIWRLKERVYCSVVSNSCDLMDCSPLDSSVHGILQAKLLEWVAILFSRGSSPPRYQTQISCIVGMFFIVWATREAPIRRLC